MKIPALRADIFNLRARDPAPKRVGRGRRRRQDRSALPNMLLFTQ